MKRGFYLNKTLVVSVIIAIITTMACNSKGHTDNIKHDIDTVGMLVSQIKSCSRLFTAECKVHKIITHNDDIKIKGSILNKDFQLSVPFSESMIAIPMDATFKAYIDFEEMSPDHVRRKGNKIEILLPYPQVVMTSSSIDHNSIRRDDRFTRITFSEEELTQYANQGRQSLMKNMNNSAIIETAKKSAANIIIPLVTQMGYDERNITIIFDESDKRSVKSADMEIDK